MLYAMFCIQLPVQHMAANKLQIFGQEEKNFGKLKKISFGEACRNATAFQALLQLIFSTQMNVAVVRLST